MPLDGFSFITSQIKKLISMIEIKNINFKTLPLTIFFFESFRKMGTTKTLRIRYDKNSFSGERRVKYLTKQVIYKSLSVKPPYTKVHKHEN